MEYKIKEITPKEMKCINASCPAIYEITPKDMQCASLLCPAIYNNKEKGKYLIIGNIADAKKYGLEKKVGEGEVLIMVDKKLIDEKGN